MYRLTVSREMPNRYRNIIPAKPDRAWVAYLHPYRFWLYLSGSRFARLQSQGDRVHHIQGHRHASGLDCSDDCLQWLQAGASHLHSSH
jgi:hypothetical protein